MTKPAKRKALDVAVEAKQAARSALNQILPQSIERRKEYGGMICADENNKCKAMPARTDDLPMTVDVGHR
jgi:hypothetical protein